MLWDCFCCLIYGMLCWCDVEHWCHEPLVKYLKSEFWIKLGIYIISEWNAASLLWAIEFKCEQWEFKFKIIFLFSMCNEVSIKCVMHLLFHLLKSLFTCEVLWIWLKYTDILHMIWFLNWIVCYILSDLFSNWDYISLKVDEWELYL